MATASFVRTFRTQVVLRVILLCVTISVGTYLLVSAWQPLMALLILSLIAWQTIALIRRLERGIKDLTRFLEAIEYSDFTQNIVSPFEDQKFKSLYGAFTRVMHVFRETRAANQAQRKYLETLVHHVGAGLVCFAPDGTVKLINNAAKKLFERPALNKVQDLSGFSPMLADTLMGIKTGEQALVKIDTDNAWLQLAINATRFNLQGETYMLVSVQNIGAELEDQELEAVQHMTRVLAHEIMNSITPIASLAGSARYTLEETSADDHGEIPEAFTDLRDALDTIEKRSQGLLNFVNSYRQIARIPRPDFQLVEVAALFRRITNLLDTQADNVDLQIDVEPANLSVLADPDQIEQVLINLTKNAIESLEGQADGQVRLEGSLSRRSRVTLKVTDNGPGIAAENQSQIFVPFYSTKTAGSGIGLSLSRQIMRRHGGSLRVQSKLGGPTSFLMHF